MKKLFTSLLFLTAALCSWGQESTEQNPKWDSSTGTLTIKYEKGIVPKMNDDKIFEGLDGCKGNVQKLVLEGNFTNDIFQPGKELEKLIKNCNDEPIYLDLTNCSGVMSIIEYTGENDEIDWSSNDFKTLPDAEGDVFTYTVTKEKYYFRRDNSTQPPTEIIIEPVEGQVPDWCEVEYTDDEGKEYPYFHQLEDGSWIIQHQYYQETPESKEVWTYSNEFETGELAPHEVQQYQNNGSMVWDEETGEGTLTLTKVTPALTFQSFSDRISGVSFPKNSPKFNSIPDAILQGNETITDVVINDGVINIGYCAFARCYNLENLEFGNTIQNISESAFEACTSLSGTLTIPSSVIEIKKMAFKACSSIVDVVFPADAALEHIYEFAFAMENPDQSSLKNVYVNCNKYIVCDRGAFGFTSTDGQTQAGTVTTRLHYPPAFYEEYVGAYKTEILGGIFESQKDRIDNRVYARANEGPIVKYEYAEDGSIANTLYYYNTKYPNGNGWWEFLSTGIPVPYNEDWPVDYNDYWRTYSDFVDLTVPEGFDESSTTYQKGINVYLVNGFDKDKSEIGEAQLVRMKPGDCIPANTGVIIHWRVEVTDQTGGFIFFAPYECAEGESYQPYDNELYPENTYKGYTNYMKPLNTRGETVQIKNVEKVNKKPAYRNFFWGNSEEFTASSAQGYKGSDFDDAGVEGWGFYRCVSGGYKVNNKAYLHLPAAIFDKATGAGSGENHDTEAGANAFSFSIVGEDVTGINNVAVTPTTDDSYYTLQGIKVNTPKEKGIYIHNGKKIILK